MPSTEPRETAEAASGRRPGTALVVLGMHRSGTSALAGTLAKIGCALPATLMGAQAENPRGYFESIALCRLNDDLLAAAGSSWSDWRALDQGWLRSEAMGAFGARAADALDQEFGAAPLIVLKDPRICRLAPFWDVALRRAGRRPLFVCTHRPPGEVAASLAKRDGMSATRARLLWLRHVLDAEAATRGQTRIFVSYEGILSGWRAALKRIADAFALKWPRAPDDAGAEIGAFLSSDLRHFDDAHAPFDDREWPWLREAVEILDRWSRRGEDAEDHARLDALSSALSEATPALSGLDAEIRTARAETRRAAAELAQRRRAAATYEFNLETQQGMRRAAEARISELEAALAAQLAERADEQGALHAQLLAANRALRLQRARADHAQRSGGLRAMLQMERERREVLASGLFDANWYLERYPDVAAANADPLRHFLTIGWSEGRSPGPHFDLVRYFDETPGLESWSGNPLLHFLRRDQRDEDCGLDGERA